MNLSDDFDFFAQEMFTTTSERRHACSLLGHIVQPIMQGRAIIIVCQRCGDFI